MKRYIPLKNYFIAIVTILIIFGLSLYFYKWHTVYQSEQTRESYLIKTNTISMQITDVSDIKTILMEAPSDYFVYISYTNSTDVLNLERRLKKIIDKYGINDVVYYIDATNMKKDSDYLTTISSSLNADITSIPAIVYVKDGVVDTNNVIQSKKGIIKASDFEKLLKDNGIEKISQ